MTRGGRRPGAGRPQAEARRGETLRVRLTAEEAEALRRLAEDAGVTVSEWIRGRSLAPDGAEAAALRSRIAVLQAELAGAERRLEEVRRAIGRTG